MVDATGRRLATLGTCAVLAAALLFPPSANPNHSRAPAALPEFGVHFHALWDDYTTDQRLDVLDKLVMAGAEWIRIDLMWCYTEVERGTYNADTLWKLNYVVDAARARGLKVLVSTFGTPGWANGGSGTATPPTDSADFAPYAKWLASTFKGRVSAWEVWNEPNWKSFWTGSPADYVALLKAAYPAFKEGDPGAQVVLGGLAGNDHKWLSMAYTVGAKAFFDVVATHPYPYPSDSPPETDPTLARTTSVRAVMSSFGDAKPIWFTEYGWSSHATAATDESWERGVTEETQGEYLVRSMGLVAAKYPYVTNVFWYNERNRVDAGKVDDNFGLLNRDLKPKPVYTAVKRLLSQADATYPANTR
jgi:polysaccharide biosynthesis protein PslG